MTSIHRRPDIKNIPRNTPRMHYAKVKGADEARITWMHLGDYQNNLFRMLMHNSTCAGHLSELLHSLTASVTLPPYLRELSILSTCHIRDIRYVWTKHYPVALGCGVSTKQLASLRKGHVHSTDLWSDEDRSLIRFTEEQLKTGRVSDATFEQIQKHLDERQIVELIILIGSYALIGDVLEITMVQSEKRGLSEAESTPR